MSHCPVLHRFAALTLSCLTAGAGAAFASASSDPSSLCDKFGAYDEVFLGTAGAPVEREVLLAPDLKPEVLPLLPVVVERSFRGAESPVMYLYFVEPPVSAGERYLIYADRLGAPPDVVRAVMVEREQDAAADLEFLESRALTPSTGTIHGVLTRGDVYDSGHPRIPLANVTIRFSSEGYTTETVTGQDGSFVVSGFEDGLVQVEPLLPDDLTAPARGVRVWAGGCVAHHIVAAVNGRVRGRVLRNDGTPYTWMVDMMAVEGKERSRRIQVRANGEGEFEFSGLLPGEYLLGVNLEGWMYRSDVRTYYPGTPDRAEAVPIAIGAGATREGLDFRLPPEVASGEIVVHIDARGAPGEVGLCVSGATGDGSGGGLYTQFARSAPVVVRVLEGRQYRIVAHVERRTGHSESREVAVTGTAGRQELTLVASRAAMPHRPNDVCGAHWRAQLPPVKSTEKPGTSLQPVAGVTSAP